MELHNLSDKSQSKAKHSTELIPCQDVMVSRLLERGNFDDKEEAISRR